MWGLKDYSLCEFAVRTLPTLGKQGTGVKGGKEVSEDKYIALLVTNHGNLERIRILENGGKQSTIGVCYSLPCICLISWSWGKIKKGNGLSYPHSFSDLENSMTFHRRPLIHDSLWYYLSEARLHPKGRFILLYITLRCLQSRCFVSYTSCHYTLLCPLSNCGRSAWQLVKQPKNCIHFSSFEGNLH